MSSDKQISILHATRNGQTGQVVVLPEQDIAAYQNFTTNLVASFNPCDAHEVQLAQLYVGFQWRLNRVAAIEDTILTIGILDDRSSALDMAHTETHHAFRNAQTFRDNIMAFDRISLYNQRLLSAAAKVLKQLQDLQAARRASEQRELTEAAAVCEFQRGQNLPFDPTESGFQFSLAQIETHIRRTNLHNRAQKAQKLAHAA
jgi:hypothetical protein